MNNNQDNFNDNPQMKILNNLNNPNFIPQNNNEPLNVIPNTNPIEQNQMNNSEEPLNVVPNIDNSNLEIQKQNTFINNPINTMNNDLNIKEKTTNQEDENPLLKLNQNKFINNNEEVKDTSLNSMNVQGEYTGMQKTDYSQDPKVQANLEMINKHGAKNTIRIGSEGKVFLIIIAVLLLFTFVMPIIYDALRKLG